jgi:hypothetical protein
MKSFYHVFLKTILLVFTALTIPVVCIADEDSVAANITKQSYFGVGAQLGLASGSGISVRHSWPNGLTLEGTAFFFSTGRPIWNFGAEVQYLLSSSDKDRLYALGGVGFYYNGGTASQNTLSSPTRIGVGIGYEWFVSNQMSVSAELPFTVFLGTGTVSVLPLPQIQFMYYFN